MIKELIMEKNSLPDGWVLKILGDFTETINGLWTGKKEPYIPVKVYTMSNFTKESDLNHSKEAREVIASVSQYEKRKLEYGDILIEKSGGGPNQPVGRAVLFDIKNNENNTFSNFTTRLRICKENVLDIDCNYLHKFLKLQYMIGETEKFQKNSTNIRNLQLKEYLQLEIPTPTITQQKQIVATLDKAFASIDTAKANAEQNLQNAKELFESYLQNIFENKGDDWEEKTLEDVCESISAGGDKPKELSKFKTEKFNIPIYANGEKNKGLYGFTNIAKILEPSITISGRGTIGYSEIRNEPFTPIVRLIVLLPKKEKIDINFLKYIVSNIDFINTGSSIPQLTVPMVKEYKITYPEIKEQNDIVQKLDELSEECKKLEVIYVQKITDLEEMKKSVLQKAFSGQLNTIN